MNILDSNSDYQELLQRRQEAKLEYLLDEVHTLQSENEALLLTISKYRTHQMDEIFSYEIDQLQKQALVLQKQNTHSKTQAFLNLQMNQQIEAFYLDIVHEQKEKIQELRRIIHDKEYTIQQQEKNTTLLNDGVAIKCKELVQLSEVSLKMHNEIENLQSELLKANSFIQQSNERLSQLNRENSIYKFELNKIKKALTNQVTHHKMKQVLLNSSDTYSDTETVVDTIKRHGSITCESRQAQSFLTPKNSELERYKKLFDSQVITTKLLQQEYNKIYKQNHQLLITNDRLCQHVQCLNKKIEKLKSESLYLEQHWQSCMQNSSPVKYQLKFEEQRSNPHSCKQLDYIESNEMRDYKNYLLQLHRSLHTVKEHRLTLLRCVSEPSRGRIITLEKKKKKSKMQQFHSSLQPCQDISIIQRKDNSIISEFIF